MKKTIPLIIALFLFTSFSPALAEVKPFIEEYTYKASEADSKLSSRTIALREVKRLLLEKLGTYLMSETEVRNFQLTKDQITTLTTGIVKTEIIDEKWNGEIFWLKAKIDADPEDVIQSVNRLRKDVQFTKELEELRKKVKQQTDEIERLKIAISKDRSNESLVTQYLRAVEELNVIELFHKAIELSIAGKLQEAVQEVSVAIQKNPKDALAYVYRGHLNVRLGNYGAAIKDSSKAIEIDPNFAWAYANRAYVNFRLYNGTEALQDSNKAIELDPQFALGYVVRGAAKFFFGKYQEIIDDSNKALGLNPNIAWAYVNRGVANQKLGNKIRAYLDIKKAIEIDDKCADAYYFLGYEEMLSGNHEKALDYLNKALAIDPYVYQEYAYSMRGAAYIKLGRYKQGLEESNKAIERITASPFNERFKFSFLAVAYNNRGVAYKELGNIEDATGDLSKAIELNPRFARPYYHRGLIYEKLGDKKLAINDLVQAAKLGDKDAQIILKEKDVKWR